MCVSCASVCWWGVGEESACWWQEDICRAEEEAVMKGRKACIATSPHTSTSAVSDGDGVTKGIDMWTPLGLQQRVSGAMPSMETLWSVS